MASLEAVQLAQVDVFDQFLRRIKELELRPDVPREHYGKSVNCKIRQRTEAFCYQLQELFLLTLI